MNANLLFLHLHWKKLKTGSPTSRTETFGRTSNELDVDQTRTVVEFFSRRKENKYATTHTSSTNSIKTIKKSIFNQNNFFPRQYWNWKPSSHRHQQITERNLKDGLTNRTHGFHESEVIWLISFVFIHYKFAKLQL